jgi:4-amino-4-deoxy-L-arabinose transferase-like glycosyltransferase
MSAITPEKKTRRLPRGHILNACLCLILFALTGYNIVTTAPTYQEFPHLASGFLSLKTHRYYYFNVNPPLSQIVAATPAVLFGGVDFTPPKRTIDLRVEHFAADQFIKANPHTHLLFLFAGRFLCCLTALCALALSLNLFYRKEPCVRGWAYILCLTQPFFLGFLSIISPDMLAAMTGLCFIAFFLKFLKSPSLLDAVFSGILLGMAFSSKFTLVVFYPLSPILWIIRRLTEPGALRAKSFLTDVFSLAVIFFLSLTIVNLVYDFDGTGMRLGDYGFRSKLFTGIDDFDEIPRLGANRFSDSILAGLPVPLPGDLVRGIDAQRYDFERGMSSYLRGRWSEHGWWYFYLYALLLKTPLGTIGIFLLALFCTFCLKGYNGDPRDELVILLPGIVLLAFVSSQTGFSIHSRYVIPALPFFLVWMSKVGRAFTRRLKETAPKSSRAVRGIAVILLLWSVGSSLWVYPHSIAYFNELAAIIPTPEDKNYPRLKEEPLVTSQKVRRVLDAGPLAGPRHLLFSSVDWNQDLFRFERWCKNHPEITELTTSLTDGYPVGLTTIPSIGSPPSGAPKSGWHALSVTDIYGGLSQYRYFRNFKPEAIIGYTIYVYHLTPEEIARFRLQNKPRSGETLP